MFDYNHSRKGGSGNLNPPFLILTVNGFNPFQSLCIADPSQIYLGGELVSILHLMIILVIIFK